jgi:hypothetical protein
MCAIRRGRVRCGLTSCSNHESNTWSDSIAVVRGEAERSRSQRGTRVLVAVEAVKRVWYKWLRRRGQYHRLTWERYNALLARYPLPRPRSGRRYRESRRSRMVGISSSGSGEDHRRLTITSRRASLPPPNPDLLPTPPGNEETLQAVQVCLIPPAGVMRKPVRVSSVSEGIIGVLEVFALPRSKYLEQGPGFEWLERRRGHARASSNPRASWQAYNPGSYIRRREFHSAQVANQLARSPNALGPRIVRIVADRGGSASSS